jgi:protein-S-isoprenylcysteine O-methyltransferase Ste14
MTQIQALDTRGQGNVIGRIIAFLYGIVAYVVFFVTFLYAIGFVEDLVVPKTVDGGTAAPTAQALIVNLVLMSIFAIQHSVMARPQFKQWWTKFVPPSVERTTYVLLASLALALLIWQWQPMPAVMWQIADPRIAMAVTGLSFVGWLIVLTSTFLINHFELFGLHQVANNRAPPDARAALPDAAALPVRAPSDLSRLHHRVLGGADDEDRTPAVRSSDNRLHHRRHPIGRARSDRHLWRSIPLL